MKKTKEPVQTGNENSKRRKRKYKPERSERIKTMLFLIPSLVGVLIFFVLPFVVVVHYSLIDTVVNQEFAGLTNYIRLIENTAFRTAVKNTLTFSVSAVPLAVVLGLMLAILLSENLPFISGFRTIFITPLMVPVASIVLIWQVIFHYNGVLNEFTALFGAAPVDWLKSEYSQVVVIILYLWKNVGYNMILFMAALANIPKDVQEVAMLEGCGRFRIFWHIKLRYLSSSIVFVSILSLINSFKVFREVYLLTDEYPYDALYMLQHFMNNTFESLDYQKLSSAAILMCLAMIVLIGIMFAVDNKVGGEIEE